MARVPPCPRTYVTRQALTHACVSRGRARSFVFVHELRAARLPVRRASSLTGPAPLKRESGTGHRLFRRASLSLWRRTE